MIEQVFMLATVAIFLAFIVWREATHSAHIRDLELKLIAKNPADYIALKSTEQVARVPRNVKDDEDDLMDVFDVKPDDFLKGQHVWE